MFHLSILRLMFLHYLLDIWLLFKDKINSLQVIGLM